MSAQARVGIETQPLGLELRRVSRTFPGGVRAVSGLDLTVSPGEFFTLVGPSGSGKTTVLRMIAGLETPDSGSVWLGGRDVTRVEPSERGVAVVFQTPALLPHLSVFHNLAFGLRARRRPRAEVRERVEAVATSLGLEALLRRRPRSLSGGQRQRVALGRALTVRPGLLLLDEPLASLDGPLRLAVRDEIARLHRTTGATIVHVTHDQAEALALSDRVAVLERGSVVQCGSPADLYGRPASRFVGSFLGDPPMSILRLRRRGRGPGDFAIVLDGAPEHAPGVPAAAIERPSFSTVGDSVDLGVRPEALSLHSDVTDLGPGRCLLPGLWRVERLEFVGRGWVATLSSAGQGLRVFLERPDVPVGAERVVGFRQGAGHWFDPTTGLALGG